MNARISRLLAAALVFAQTTSSPAQSRAPSFDRITIDQGLASNDVRAIVQDRLGFLWIGTADGLDLYDGYSFTHFKHTPFDTTSLPANAITAVYEDRYGILWIGTVNGLCRLDRDEHAGKRFQQFLNDPDNPKSLSSNAVSALCEDVAGNLWVGTFDQGLNRFDREQLAFTQFRQERGNPYGLNHNTVSSLHCDRSGRLWVGTARGGLQQFDVQSGRFTTFTWHHPNFANRYFRYSPAIAAQLDSLQAVAALLQIGDDEYRETEFSLDRKSWIAIAAMGEAIAAPWADWGWLENAKTGQKVWEMRFEDSRHAGGSIKNRQVIEVIELPPGRYRLCYRSDDSHSFASWNAWAPDDTLSWGIQVFAIEEREARRFARQLQNALLPTALSHPCVTHIADDPRPDSNLLWIGTAQGLNQFDPETKTFMHYLCQPDDPNSLSSSSISSILFNDPGSLWVGTRAGLNRIEVASGRIERFHEAVQQEVPGARAVTSICKDKSGVVWAGTRGEGLHKLAPKKFVHQVISADATCNKILSFYQDETGKLWLGTTNGLSILNQDGSPAAHYRHEDDKRTSLSAESVTFIKMGHAGDMWIGTHGGGLNRFDPRKGEFEHFRSDESDSLTLSSDLLRCMAAGRDSVLWLGTAGFGLNRFDPTTGRATRYFHRPNDANSLPSNDINDVFIDHADQVWIGTSLGGLSRLDPQSGRITNYLPDPNDRSGLCNKTINVIYEDRAGTLWLGTYSGGLCALQRDANGSDIFTHYTVKEGLPSNKILGILEDELGDLWISSNEGLTRFDPVNDVFRNYTANDGLQGKHFFTRACFRNAAGEMFFGGANGFNRFFPTHVQDSPYLPPVVLTQFKMPDRIIALDDTSTAPPEVRLRHHENFFSFEFVALDYNGTDNIQYAYKLEGFDADWTYCGGRRFANYTNVVPGSYRFRVKATNNDGVWNEPGAAIRLVVTPPFWQRWWFLVLASALVLLAIYLLHNLRVRQKIKTSLEISRIRYAEREAVREQIARDYHDEVGHKITKIALFAELIKRHRNGRSDQVVEHLDKVTETSQGLCLDTRDFIWTLNPQRDTLYDLALRLKEFGDSLFDESEITFHLGGVSNELANIRLPMEWKRHLTLLFKEGMNNVVRHAQCQNVSLSLKVRNGILEIVLADDGSGHNGKATLSTNGSGSGIGNMKRRAQELGGDFEVRSTPGGGTTLRFSGTLPPNGY